MYRHLLTFYYMKEQLSLPTHFVVMKVVHALHKAKPGVGSLVKQQIYLVTLVCGFEIRNEAKVISGF